MEAKRIRKTGDERRKEIKQSILEIVFTDGIHKLSTRYLAQKVGLSEGALFRHYPNKKAMIEDIISDVKIELIDELKKIAYGSYSPQKRLDEFITFTLKYLYNKKGITMILFTEASHQNDEGLKQSMNSIYELQKQYFAKIVLDGISRKIWDNTINVESLTRLYMGIPVTLNIEMILNPDKFNIEIFCNQMKNIILKVLSKRVAHTH